MLRKYRAAIDVQLLTSVFNDRVMTTTSTLSICIASRRYGTSELDPVLHENMCKTLCSLQMPHRKIKMAIACSSIVILGFGIPTTAIQWQKHKAAG